MAPYQYGGLDMHPATPPKKALIRQTALCGWLDLSRSGLDKLRKKDPTFPKPIKSGDSRQAAAFFVVSEIDAWLARQIQARDAQ